MTALDTTRVIDEQRLRSLLDEGWLRARRRRRSVLVSLALRVPAYDHLTFFEHGAGLAGDRLLWACPGGDFALTGIGAAWSLSLTGTHRFAEAAAAWHDRRAGALVAAPAGLPGVGPLLMGGFAFDPLRPASGHWTGYPDGLLILPRYLLTTVGGSCWLTVNAILEPDSDPAAVARTAARAIQTLLGDRPLDDTPAGSAGALHVAEVLPAATWQAAVTSLTRTIWAGSVDKVVLARECRVRAARPFDSTLVLRRLRATSPSCFLFAVARGDRCFLGATPEQLVRLRDGQVITMSLAGSIARGATEEEDCRLGEALLASAKDQVEHAIVVRAVREALAGIGVELAPAGAPVLMKLRNVQHLRTTLTGRSAGEHTILDLLEHLHPTPAVGGYPRATALRLIREREQLDRGWYAGPVGWLDAHGEGEFAVAIRSALLQGATASLFAGCGIVADSDPAREYAESSLKLRAILTALEGSTA